MISQEICVYFCKSTYTVAARAECYDCKSFYIFLHLYCHFLCHILQGFGCFLVYIHGGYFDIVSTMWCTKGGKYMLYVDQSVEQFWK